MRYHCISYYHILSIISTQTILNISNLTISQCIDSATSASPPQFRSVPARIIKRPSFCNRSIRRITPFCPPPPYKAGMSGSPNPSTIQSKSPRHLSGASEWVFGGDLLSHGRTTLSSALSRFTVLFGMGRRGTNSLWPPNLNCTNRQSLNQYIR